MQPPQRRLRSAMVYKDTLRGPPRRAQRKAIINEDAAYKCTTDVEARTIPIHSNSYLARQTFASWRTGTLEQECHDPVCACTYEAARALEQAGLRFFVTDHSFLCFRADFPTLPAGTPVSTASSAPQFAARAHMPFHSFSPSGVHSKPEKNAGTPEAYGHGIPLCFELATNLGYASKGRWR